MSKTALTPHISMAKPAKKDELKELERLISKRYGFVLLHAGIQEPPPHPNSLGNLEVLLERHPDWYIKRYNAHRWEVRTGVKDTTYYGETLAEALCRALLEIP